MLDFSAGELAQLCDLISGTSTDILFKADCEGFIMGATRGIALLGAPLPTMLIPPRLQDLVTPSKQRVVEAELALAVAGNSDRGWIEFRLGSGPQAGRWYSLRLVPAGGGAGKGGVLGILRDVHERRMLEERVFAARLTDPLTGLTNRIAFDAMIAHLAAQHRCGSLALLGIDHFKAINHRLGHSFGDEILSGFARVLRTVMRTGDIVSRVGASRFAVLMPDTSPDESSLLCRQAARIFTGELRAGKVTLPLSASSGIAPLGRSARDTLHRAELALIMGRSGHQSVQRPATRSPAPECCQPGQHAGRPDQLL